MANAWRDREQGSEGTADALAGVRILDLSGVGAYVSMLLSDFGADVIRVAAATGALLKPKMTTGSRFDPAGAADPARSAAFNALHRNQRSIALNLHHPDGQAVLQRLASDADVVLESFRPGVTARLGADYETLAALNPRLVYCSLSGYGQTGPYRDMPGHDLNYIALGGLLGVTRRPGAPPTMPINVGADFAGGGLFAALSIMIALHARTATGRGQYIDMAMSDGVLSLLTAAFIGYFADGETIEPGEYFLNGGAPWYEAYECADGHYVTLGCIEPHFFRALCDALGLEAFVARQHDVSAYPELRRAIGAALSSQTADEWMALFLERGIAASPMLEFAEIPANAQFKARAMVSEVETAAGPAHHIGIAPKLSATPGRIRGPAPQPGQHTESILRALGYGREAISRLREEGVIDQSLTDSKVGN